MSSISHRMINLSPDLCSWLITTWTQMRTTKKTCYVFTMPALRHISITLLALFLSFFLSHHHSDWFVQIAVACDTLGTKRLAVVALIRQQESTCQATYQFQRKALKSHCRKRNAVQILWQNPQQDFSGYDLLHCTCKSRRRSSSTTRIPPLRTFRTLFSRFVVHQPPCCK